MPEIYLYLYITYLVLPCTSMPRVISSYSCSTLKVLFNITTKTSKKTAVFIQFKKAFKIGILRDVID